MMDAVKFLEEHIRMCESITDCCVCPFTVQNSELCLWDCIDCSPVRIKEAISIVEKWSAEHPQKTRLQDFLEKYPDAPLYEDDEGKFPMLCPSVLGYCGNGSSFPCGDCPYDEEPETFCWNLPLE